MHELLDVKLWPRALLRYPLLILTALLLGALLAFSYSYAPLHRAKDWKIGYLEERFEVRSEQVRTLEADLAKATASLDGTPSGEEVGAIRTQLGESTRLAESRRGEIGSLKKKLDQMQKSRDQWKRRHAAAVGELEKQTSLASAPPAAEAEPTPVSADTAGDAAPAAPADTAPAPTDPVDEAPEAAVLGD